MDLFDLLDNPQAGQAKEVEPFNWEKFKAGAPAMSRDGRIGYYAGKCKHPLNTHLFLVSLPVIHKRTPMDPDSLMFLIDERGHWEGSANNLGAPSLISMA